MTEQCLSSNNNRLRLKTVPLHQTILSDVCFPRFDRRSRSSESPNSSGRPSGAGGYVNNIQISIHGGTTKLMTEPLSNYRDDRTLMAPRRSLLSSSQSPVMEGCVPWRDALSDQTAVKLTAQQLSPAPSPAAPPDEKQVFFPCDQRRSWLGISSDTKAIRIQATNSTTTSSSQEICFLLLGCCFF